MGSLENERTVIFKPADKGSSIVVWDRLGYLEEAEKQLSDSNTYKEVKLSEKDQTKSVEKRNSMFEGLKKNSYQRKREKLLLNLILKRLLTLVSYILYPRYIKSSVACRDAPLFRTAVPPQKKFQSS